MGQIRTIYKSMLIIALFVLATYVLFKNHALFASIIAGMMRVLTPFVTGGALAFIINIPMCFIEEKLYNLKCFHSKRGKSALRATSMILTLLIAVGVIAVILCMIVPELYKSVAIIGKQLRVEAVKIPQYLDMLADTVPVLKNQIHSLQQAWINIKWDKVSADVLAFLQAGGFFANTVNMASGILMGVVNFFIGIIFAVYCLFQKEILLKQMKRLLYAVFQESRVDRFLEVCHLACTTFQHFFSGQCLEALFLGTLFLAVLLIFRFPYALVIAVLVSVIALIPVFGSFISCMVGAWLILMVNPVQALWFIVVFLILQQIEGNFIYPRVVGSSVGLPPIWVFVAVTLGASMGGVFGVIVAIPLTSVIYTLLREFVNKRVIEKKINKQKYEA